jgi:4-aminobutyrate aminotransferase/(S)-3-amino-2-methylpropionate transaminase
MRRKMREATLSPRLIAEPKVVVRDAEGKEYLDFRGDQLNVVQRRRRVEAICEQAKKYLHSCFMVQMYEPYIALAKELNQIAPGNFPKKSFFVNSGAEAVENAIKIARYYTKRPAIICFEYAFHGRTYMTMSLTSKVKYYKYGFGLFMSEVYRAPMPIANAVLRKKYPSCEAHCADVLEKILTSTLPAESVAAIIVEPAWEGGFIVPPQEYLGNSRKSAGNTVCC